MSRSKLRSFGRFLVIVGIPVLALVGAMTMVSMKPPPEKKETTQLDLLVEVLPLTSSAAHFSISSQGNVQPRTETVLSAELSGIIVSMSDTFVAGGVFNKNEVLLRIDPSNYSIAVDQAKALLTQRQIEYDGAIQLKQKGYQSDAEVASAAAALASAQAGLKRARRDLERTAIRLPYSGMVRSKAVSIGQYVGPGTRLGVTFATDFAEVRLPITDLDRTFLQLPEAGANASDDLTTAPAVTLHTTRKSSDTSWAAHITRTEGVVDENTRVTYAVARVDDPYNFNNPQENLTPLQMGTFVQAKIDGLTLNDVIIVPRGAMRGSDQLLFVDSDSRLRLGRVQVLRTDSEFAYLTAGAKDGDRIVLTAIESPINGTKVRVKGEAATESGIVNLTSDRDDATVTESGSTTE